MTDTPTAQAHAARHAATVPPHEGDHPLKDPTPEQRRQALVAGVLLVLTSVTTTLAAFTNPPADARLHRMVRETSLLAWVDGADVLRSSAVLAAAALVAVLGWRCRTYLVIASASLLAGYGLAVGLPLLFPRERPVESPVPGADSYPSLSILLLTVIAGTVPEALQILTRRMWARHVAAGVLAVVVGVSGLEQVRAGLHWPLDVIGAVLLGTLLVLVFRVVLEEPDRHGWCRSCPWREQLQAPPEDASHVALPAVDLGPRWVHRIHETTLVWTVGVVIAFGYLTWTRGIPRVPESGALGYGLEAPVQYGSLALMVLGVLLARRWHMTGAFVVGFAAVFLGYAASVEYSAMVAVLITVAVYVPAFLLWLEWHRRASLRAALTVAVVTSLVLGGVVTAAADTYASYWGPTHPASATPAPDGDVVTWMWSGAVTPTSATVRARTAQDAESVRLVASESADLADPVRSAPVPSSGSGQNVVSLTLDGLTPDTLYHYALEVDGDVETDRIGTLHTFPQCRSSFSFALSGDALTGSNGQVFDAVREVDPLFFLMMGDFYYGDVDRNDPGLVRDQFESTLTAPAQATLWGSTSIAYVWGDHDYAGNNSNRNAAAGPATHEVYRDYVPHYELAGGDQTPVYQAFTVGRVRFVMTDNRSARDPSTDPPVMLGEEQLAWLESELDRADQYAAVIWMNGDPWVGQARPGSDTWAGFADERRRVADAIAERGVDNLLMVSGDAHMLAFDDGTNTDYSTSGAGGFPLLQAAALDRKASMKGGPYTGPVIPGGGQFATIDVADDGSTVDLTLTGWNWRSEELFSTVVTFDASTAQP